MFLNYKVRKTSLLVVNPADRAKLVPRIKCVTAASVFRCLCILTKVFTGLRVTECVKNVADYAHAQPEKSYTETWIVYKDGRHACNLSANPSATCL